LHDTQVSAQAGGAITLVAGVVLLAGSFLWARYSIAFQERAVRLMRRGGGYSTEAAERLTRGFGTVFLLVAGLICFIVGLIQVVSH
jgi:hypothetical protein